MIPTRYASACARVFVYVCVCGVLQITDAKCMEMVEDTFGLLLDFFVLARAKKTQVFLTCVLFWFVRIRCSRTGAKRTGAEDAEDAEDAHSCVI